jgi:hypothetical protein
MRRRFLDAELFLPQTAAQARRMLAVPLLLAAVAALGGWMLWGALPGALLVAAGAFIGAGLRSCGVDVLRTPKAWWTVFGAVALMLALTLVWLLR